MRSGAEASRVRRRAWSLAATVVALAAACALLQLFAIRPFLPPAGHGALLVGESAVLEGVALRLLTARPPRRPRSRAR